MTAKTDDALSSDDLVPILEQANSNLRKRLSEARENLTRMTDAADEYHAKLKRRDELKGSGYRYRSICSDGRVFAVPALEAREETIRWFAGQALPQALADYAELTRVAKRAREAALMLWTDLESHFEAERAEHKAADAEPESEPTDGQPTT